MKTFLLPIFLLVPIAACSSSSNVTPVGTTPDAGDPDAGAVDAPAGGPQCSTARDQLLLPIDKTSTGAVTILSDTGGKKTIYVDASAGGFQTAAKSPRIYLDLGAGTRVAVTDKSASSSTAWDLGLKRYVIFTNSGDVGSGGGGAVQIPKAFASVTDGEVTAASPAAESMFDADCNAKLDRTQAPLTTFSDWYDYDDATMIPSPKANVTYVVRGGTGRLYKVAIKAYDALPDGGSRNNMSTGFFLLEVTEVTAK
ncbi:MAG TPA: HmuY family protein [Labilithrix sp.]|nr:HmuY family protein [Labilithrix sp.]